MAESTTIIAFDQHAQSVMAAVLGPSEAEPALHPLTSDLPTIGRFVKRLLGADPCAAVTRRDRVALHCSDFSSPTTCRVRSSRRR